MYRGTVIKADEVSVIRRPSYVKTSYFSFEDVYRWQPIPGVRDAVTRKMELTFGLARIVDAFIAVNATPITAHVRIAVGM